MSRPAKLCQSLARSIADCGDPEDDIFQTVLGKTISTDDFYEGKGRLDKMEFLHMVQSVFLCNIAVIPRAPTLLLPTLKYCIRRQKRELSIWRWRLWCLPR